MLTESVFILLVYPSGKGLGTQSVLQISFKASFISSSLLLLLCNFVDKIHSIRIKNMQFGTWISYLCFIFERHFKTSNKKLYLSVRGQLSVYTLIILVVKSEFLEFNLKT